MLYKELKKTMLVENMIACGLFFVVVLHTFQICGGTVYYNGLQRNGYKVCEDSSSRSYSYTRRVTVVSYQGYTTSCGLFGWARCQRSRTVTGYAYRRYYSTAYDISLRCCRGWRKTSSSSSSCSEAICSSGCYHGTCVSPNSCSCSSGWTGYTCNEDINECSSNNGGCQHGCINKRGNTQPLCTCRSGFRKHGKRCYDINECNSGRACSCTNSYGSNTCGARCYNTQGSFYCSCGKGYRRQHRTVCTDNNECAYNNGGCSRQCVNFPGGFRCACPRGFRLYSTTRCKDVNECESNNGNCQHTCQNLFGRHRCHCREGFVLDSNARTCSDVEECKLGKHDCEVFCNNTLGGYFCSCRKGYKLTNDNKTCTDINECSASLSACHHNCTNVEGSFQCFCRNGYALMYDKKRCEEIDECKSGNHSCEHNCHNTDGSYRCSCRAGFKLSPDGKCEGMPCEKILPPRHGEMVCSGNVTEANCAFSCNPGYDLVGSQSRTCLPTSRWSGSLTSCKAKHCEKLTTKVKGQTISVPCFSSFGSTCYFGCRPGFFLQGDGRANCSLNSKGDGVSWEIGSFTCEEVKTCKPNPCRHGGKCLALNRTSFACACEGTGYKGNQCQTGFVSTPIFPKLRLNISSGTLDLMARPSKRIQVSLHSGKGLTFEPLSVDIQFSKNKGEFTVKGEKPGIQVVTYTLEGESKNDFQTPQRSVVLVAPAKSDDNGQSTALQLPKEELPIGCEEHRRKQSCEMRLLSTEPWTGTPVSTNGIVHFTTANNHTIPLSLTGLNLKDLRISREELIAAAIAKTSPQKAFLVLLQRNEGCQSRVANSGNLLELMNNDAFASSFMQAFSEMAPEWLNLAVNGTNNAFDIQNIAVNLAPDSEHCSGFLMSKKSSHAYYRPAVHYKMLVDQQEVSLFADGSTCFTINFCQPAVFINFPEIQANILKSSLNVFRNMKDIGVDLKVDSIGFLDSMETYQFVKGIVWNGMELQELLPFSYNMWLKGSLNWQMKIPKLLSVTVKVTGETMIKSRNIHTLFSDHMSQPLEAQFNGKASVNITGRALTEDFTMILNSPVNGKAVLGGNTFCSENVQGIFWTTSESSVSSLLRQSPFSSYIRPKKSEPVRLAILMSLRGSNRERGHVETNLQGISLYLRTNLCMGKLCFNDLNTTVDFHTERICYLNASSVSMFHVKGKVLKTLSAGKILTVPSEQIINIVFPRDSDLVSANFEANVRLLDLSQRSNVTLDKKQLSFEMKGEIFHKYMTDMIVVADTDHVPEWSSLRFIVHGSMMNSSLLSKSLQAKVINFAKYLARKAAKKVQSVENSLLLARQRVDSATTLVQEKQSLLNEALQKKQIKYSELQNVNIAYGNAKSQLNSSLTQYLKVKNKKLCELQSCSYIDTDTCIPTVCQKEIIVNYSVPNCHKESKKMVVDEIVQVEEEEVEWKPTYTVKRHSTCGGGTSTTLQSIGSVMEVGGTLVSAIPGAGVVGGIVAIAGSAVKFIGTMYDSMFGCDYYDEKIEGPPEKVIHKVTRNKLVSRTVEIEEFVCKEPKLKYVISGYRPTECCKNEISGKVKVLDPKCVSHNWECSNNMTLLSEEIEFEKERLKLHEQFQALTNKGKQATITQLELSKARGKFDFVANQLEIARALLKQHEHALESINLTTVRAREKLGLKLGEKLKSLKGKTLVSVDRLVFSVSMARSSTKTRFPLTAYLKTFDGKGKAIEFPMDFTNEDHSLTVASRLVVETLFGLSLSRRRRSSREEPIMSKRNDSGLSLGQHECLFSQEANIFFSDVMESVEFAIKSKKELEATMLTGLRGLEKLPVEEDNTGAPLSGPTRDILAAFSDTVQSLKETYLNSSRMISWNTTLNDLRGFLDVLSRKNNFTECSGIQDCIDFFFDSLGEMYETEYHPRAIEIKSMLKELEGIISKILKEDQPMAVLEAMTSQAKSLINKSKDDMILCSKKPNIQRNSPEEVVTTSGETVTLVCEATSPIEVKYMWLKNGKPLEHTNRTILELRNVTRESEGAYKCQVSNSRGTVASNVTIVVVHEKPNITKQPADVQALVGEQILSLVCNSTGVPLPLTEWFFIPMKGKASDVQRINTTEPVLEMHDLTTKNAGFYYCNASNFRGTVQSRMARVDILSFAPGVPRIAMQLTLKQCPHGASPINRSFSHNSSKSFQQDDLRVTFRHFAKKLFEYVRWPLVNIESQHYSPFPNASISFIVRGDDPSIPDNSSSKKLDALNGFSLSRKHMGNNLKKLYSALEDESLTLKWKNTRICGEKESFVFGFLPQRCPNGTRRHENGFLCVNCAPGYYGVANGTCLQCPSGTYQSDEGSTECLKCPFRRSLTTPGALRESQCIDITIPCKPPENSTKNVQVPNDRKLYRTGETIALGCKIGYKGIGNGTQECDEGNWTTTDFYCEKTCFPPWSELKKRCYKVIDVPSHRWKDASAKCTLQHSHMVTISSEEENEFAAQLAKAYLKTNNMTQVQMWLGLRKVHAQAAFQWVDGSSLANFTNWTPGEPNNAHGRELCTEMLVSGNSWLNKWNDVRCDTTSYKAITICEKPLRKGD